MSELLEKYQNDKGTIRVLRGDLQPRITVRLAPRPQRRWSAGDWFSFAVIGGAVLWLLLAVAPAFFDGRVAQVVGR